MKTEPYTIQKKRLPDHGKHIIGQLEDDSIIVYQAYRAEIARYALEHQKFGGSSFKFERMSWIKPGFLWMMHRSGWATKENQERILAIRLPLTFFRQILAQATISSFDQDIFSTRESWQAELERTDVRLQWDPDHDPYGEKQQRKAIQIGMKGETLRRFATEWVTGIDDITTFVHDQYVHVENRELDKLQVPFEEVLELRDDKTERRIGIK